VCSLNVTPRRDPTHRVTLNADPRCRRGNLRCPGVRISGSAGSRGIRGREACRKEEFEDGERRNAWNAWSANLFVSWPLADHDRSRWASSRGTEIISSSKETLRCSSASVKIIIQRERSFRQRPFTAADSGAKQAGGANPIAAEYFDRFINSDKKTAERRRSSSPTSAYSASAFVGGNAANIRARWTNCRTTMCGYTLL